MLVKNFCAAILRLSQDNKAVTTIEYGMMAALISVVIIQALIPTGKNVVNTFTHISAEL